MAQKSILAVDVGSVSAAIVEVGPDQRITRWDHRAHNGRVGQTIRDMLADWDLAAVAAVAATSGTPELVQAESRVDWMTALVTAHRLLHPEVPNLLVVGGERFALVRFDEDGNYRSSRGNTSCAAGTGGFLDQQAARLGLSGAAELAQLAVSNTGTRPRVASRCSVFAKTDLIHAQQEGYTLPEICDGLCHGLSRNLVDAVVTGTLPAGELVMAGGVAQNRAVVKHVGTILGREVHTDDLAPVYAAYGTALAAMEAAGTPGGDHTVGGRRAAGHSADGRSADAHSANGYSANGHRAGARGAGARGADHPAESRRLTAEDILSEQTTRRSFFHESLEEPDGYPDFHAHEHTVVEPELTGGPAVEVDLYVRQSPDADPAHGRAAPAGGSSGPGRPAATSAATAPASSDRLYLGVDIGSTSTKAVLMAPDGEPQSAFYTRTAGAPIRALQAILETIDQTGAATAPIAGAACTGSGRKLIGGVMGADVVVDEISAHARAAAELNPEVDTIIEIGGQDAKFTTLRNGRVTFSQMNAVCAAGTGSFLEEQAGRLGVPISEYASRALGSPAPLASDRCTVFMERDLNHYINKGYGTDELLAAALHSVRENYLQKVASLSAIGDVIAFQGATAKNRGLVAAFEQRLGKPIMVSRYCHVTGALGAALICREEHAGRTSFRGMGLYRTHIPIRSERCTLCTNHCRLTIAEVGGEEVAYGFLCGRDYATPSFVSANTSGFDLMGTRRTLANRVARPRSRGGQRGDQAGNGQGTMPAAAERSLSPGAWARSLFSGDRPEQPSRAGVDERPLAAVRRAADDFLGSLRLPFSQPSGEEGRRTDTRVGIPSGLHLAEEHAFWLRVFAELGIPTVKPREEESLTRGKQLQGAEFCSPVAAFHGQVSDLLQRADVVFVPIHLEKPDPENRRRAYCYYTQFTPSVVKGAVTPEESERLVMPLLWGGGREPAVELAEALEPWAAVTPGEVRRAMRIARDAHEQAAAELKEQFRTLREQDAVDVVLLGRPYTALAPSMNKKIPDIFGRHGTRCFYQDMLPRTLPSEASRDLIDSVHWRYAADILLAADYIARTPGLYPVFVTSFKCAPDAFCMDAFKRIMDERDKPYLILQLDEHDSSVGYETRIEAAIRAFRNHHQEAAARAPVRPAADAPAVVSGDAAAVSPALEEVIGEKTLLFPNWDPITVPLLVANLRAHGINALALRETPLEIQKSMRLNTGQCIPVSAIAQEAMDYVRDHDLDPAQTVLWMGKSDWSCGIPLYPRFLKATFEREGLPELGVYLGDFTYTDISPAATIGAYFAYQFGGWLRRISCRIRPYEVNPGQTDALLTAWRDRMETVFEYRGNRIRALRRMADEFRAVPVSGEQKPRVGIFGDLYVRDNDVMNQDLIRTIEEAGGEAVTTPYSDYAKIIAASHFGRMRRRRELGGFAKLRLIMGAIERMERRYHRVVEDLVGPPVNWRRPGLEDDLARFNMVLEQAGESYENALKILHLVTRYPDISLFVQTSPAFCCPSLVTEALSELIERVVGVPIVTVTYDGTSGDKNGAIVPYIRFARRRGRRAAENTPDSTGRRSGASAAAGAPGDR